MANDRISQLPVEGVVAPDNAKARVSQEPTEVVAAPTSAKARLSQEPVEAVAAPTSAKARLSQQVVEVLSTRVQVVDLGLITQAATCFAPTVDQGQQIVFGRIDRTAVAFAPSISYQQFYTPALINQAAVAFAPDLTRFEITLARISNPATAFAPAIDTGVVIVPRIDQFASAFMPTVSTPVDVDIFLGLINRTAGAFSPRVMQPGVATSSQVELLYDGLDIIDDVVIADAQFTTQVNGIPGSCRVRVKDTPNTASFEAGKELLLRVDGDNVWRGFVAMIHRTYAFDAEDRSTPKERFFVLDGFDINILFRKRIVFNQADPVDLIGPRYTADNTWDTVAISDLFDDFLDLTGDGIDTTTLVEHIGYVNIDHPASPIQPSGTWENTMRGITSLINSLFYIDPDKHFVHTDVDTPNAPLDLSDQPGVGAVGYREMDLVTDGTGLINDALVWGLALGGTAPVISREQDAASIALHGRWQYGEINGSMYKQGTVDRRASSIVDGSPLSKRGAKNDKISVAVTVFTDGFRVAQKVNFSSNVFDFNDVIPIRRMDITFANPTQLRYRLYLSHEIDMPWGFFDNYFYNWRIPPIPPFPPFDPFPPVLVPCSPDEIGPFYGIEDPNPVTADCNGATSPHLSSGPVSNPDPYFGQSSLPIAVQLYAGATYTVIYNVTHATTAPNGVDTNLWVSLISTTGAFRHATVNMGSNFEGTAVTTATVTFVCGATDCYSLGTFDTGSSGGNYWGSTAQANVSYVAGPDPRFENREFVLGVGPHECQDGLTEVSPSGEGRWDITTDGATTVFFLPTAYQPATTVVFIDGVFQRPGIDYTESNPATGEFTISPAPADGAVITIFYFASRL